MSRKILLILIFFGFFLLVPLFKNNDTYAACSANWELRGTDDRDWSVVYHLTLNDNCAGQNNYDIRVTNRSQNEPRHTSTNETLKFNWEVNNAGNNDPVSISVVNSRNIDVTVKRVRTVFHTNGWYDYVIVRASNSEASDTIQLRYRVENKPDLEIVPEFVFTGGCIGTRSNPVTLRITNSGWIPIPSKANGGGFTVRVHNGVGDYEDVEVTQRIARGDVVNLTSRLSNRINIPGPAGRHTARATLDLRGEINEEDDYSEANNKSTYDYTSRNCNPTNPPPSNPPPSNPPPPSGGPSGGPSPDPDASDAWIQGSGGDMRIDHGLYRNIIPEALVKYFSETVPTVIRHGVVFMIPPLALSENGNHADKANETKWLVRNAPFKANEKELNTSYTNITTSLRKSGALINPINLASACGGSTNNCNLPSSITQGVYTTDDDVVINSSVIFAEGTNHKYYIFLIKGDLTIRNNIRVTPGTSAVFIAGGDIKIAPNVRVIEGIYSADRHFVIESNSPSVDQDLMINGSVVVNAKGKLTLPDIGIFSGKRNLGAANKTAAGVQINYRPDFVLNSPLFIRITNQKRVEVAPGE